MHACIYVSKCYVCLGCFHDHTLPVAHLCVALFFGVFFFLWGQIPFQRTISINNRRTVSSRVRANRSKVSFPLHRSPLSYFKTPVFPILGASVPKSQPNPFELSLADPVNHCFGVFWVLLPKPKSAWFTIKL